MAELCREDKIFNLLEEYILFCHSSDTNKELFPNLAGFCRFLKIGTGQLKALCHRYPHIWDRIITVLEDEALNSKLSATLLSSYLKKQLGYEGSHKPDTTAASQLEIRFEHDIFEDGE